METEGNKNATRSMAKKKLDGKIRDVYDTWRNDKDKNHSDLRSLDLDIVGASTQGIVLDMAQAAKMRRKILGLYTDEEREEYGNKLLPLVLLL